MKGKQMGKPLVIMLGGLIAYILVFMLFHHAVGPMISALYITVAIAAGWLLGMRGGLLFGLLSIPINSILLHLTGLGFDAALATNFSIGHSVLVLTGGIVGEIRDLKEQVKRELAVRTQVEAMLRESEEKYRAIVENSPNLVAIYQDGVLKYVNKAMCERLGWTAEEMTAPSFNPIEKLVPQRFQTLAKETADRRLRGERIPPSEFNVITRNGSEIPTMDYSQRIIYQGKPAIEVILIDITKRKQTEVERLETIGQVARGIIHDVRNPLSAIRTAAYILRDTSDERRGEMLKLIDRNIDSADRIMENLTDLVTVPTLKLAEMNVNLLLREAISQIVLPENIKLTESYSDILPAKVDRAQLIRVFTNLIKNSVEAMPEGGELNISTRLVGELIEIKINDTGTGISKGNFKKIFDPFFTTKAKGIGLGLANAKRAIEAHGGTIIIESEEGRGATVTIRLPLRPPSSGED